MILIVSTINSNLGAKGDFFWGSKYLPSIKKYLPQKDEDLLSIKEGIIYFARSNQRELEAKKFNIKKSVLTDSYFKVFYELTETMEFKSYQIREAHKKYFGIENIMDLPFCSAVDESYFIEILGDINLKSQIKFLQGKNKWEEIYRLFQNEEPIEKSPLWHKPEVLSDFSFAIAKLSECSENLKRKIPDKKEREKFLKEKRKFRDLCIKLRKRCVELMPENASYLSNLGYTYYQSVKELTTPGGRRDGNLMEESKLAIDYLSRSLNIEPNRITDLYRRAKINYDVLWKLSMYSDIEKPYLERYSSSKQFLEQAEEDLFKVVSICENQQLSEIELLRLKKYYIKSLYNLAHINLNKSKISFNTFAIFDGELTLYKMSDEEIEEKRESLKKADDYITRCIIHDCEKENLKELIEQGMINNFLPGVYKLYMKGLIQFYLYLYTKEEECNIRAKEFFYQANETEFPPELRRQNKLFVLEKIALMKIIEKKYIDAINLLEPIYNEGKIFPDYAAYTLCIAYILNKNENAAKKIIETFSSNPKSPMRSKFEKLMDNLILKKAKFYIVDEDEKTDYEIEATDEGEEGVPF